jgi:tripartite ATP-independent transporter DctP family solute receptor
MKKIIIMIFCLILTITVLGGCSENEETQSNGAVESSEEVIWKYAHSEAADGIMDMYAHKFGELLSQSSDGRVTLEIYPVGQLGDSAAQLELLQTGGLEFASFAVAEVGTTYPETQAMSVNFLFSNDEKVNQKVLTQGEGTKKTAEIIEDKGIHVLDWYSLGFQNWTSNKPLHNLADFKGFKMRIMNTPIIKANYDAFGASPAAVPFMETYSGLQLNMIDGTEQPINAIQEMKFYEVQDFITLSNHSILPCFTGVNKKFWESLSAEDQKLIEGVIPDLQIYASKILYQVQTERKEKILEAKPEISIIELTPEERQSFKEASISVRDKVEEIAGEKGKEIMDLIAQDVEKFESEK